MQGLNRPATRRMMRAFGGYTDYYGDYSAACYYVACAAMFGTTYPASVYSDDMLHSKLIVLFGANPMVTRSGGDNAGYYLLRAKQAGAAAITPYLSRHSNCYPGGLIPTI